MTFAFHKTRPRPRLQSSLVSSLVACLVLSISLEALAGPFLDEINAGTTDHRGHDHSGETNQSGTVDGIDATCATVSPCAPASKTDFSNTDFLNTQFTDSDFTEAIFDGAIFSFTDISKSIFAEATFFGAIFDDAVIDLSDFTDADFYDGGPTASFQRAIVRESPFDGADLQGTDFTDTQFLDMEFTDSNFTAAIFDGVVFSFTDISESSFAGATFFGATLDDAFIDLSDFTDADFYDGGPAASFQRAIVRGSQFDGADFQNTDFTDTQFRCIIDPDQTSSSEFSTVCPTFIKTVFRGANLTSTLFAPAFTGDRLVFSAADFRGANFTDAILATITDPCLEDPVNVWSCMTWGDDPAPATIVTGLTLLNASDLRGSDMRNLDFERGEFPGVLIGGTNFSGSTFTDTNFDASIASCEVIKLSDHDKDDDDYDEVVAARNAEIDLCAFLAGIPADKANFRDSVFDGASFRDANLGGSDFTDAEFTDVVLDRVSLGCDNSPEDFDADCGDCAIFSGVFLNQPAPVDGEYNIQMRNIDFDDMLACSGLRAGAPLIDTFSNMDLNDGSFKSADVTAVNFTGANLVGVNFNQSVMTGVNFDAADLSLADLSEAADPCAAPGDNCVSFIGSTLTLANLSDTAFPMVDFDDAILDGVIAVNTDFIGASFGDQDADGTGASLIGATLSSSQFDNATFTDADLTSASARCLTEDGETICASFAGATFTDSDLSNVDFSGADLRGTQFDASDLSGANFSSAQFDDTTSFSGSQIDGLNLLGVDLTQASSDLFQGKADFDPELDEDASDALGVRFGSADLSGFNFDDLKLQNWGFNGADISGASFTGAELDGAQMQSVQFDQYFAGLTVDNNFFAGVDLTNADLRNLDLTGFDLSGANLTNVRITSTLFINADLRGATLVSLDNICDGGEDCAEFTNAQLGCADLASTNFSNFAVRDGSNALVNDATLLFQFVDPDLSGIKLVGENLTGYDFSDLDLSGADLQGSTLSGANFTGATLNGARMQSTEICPTGGASCAVFSNTDLVGSTDCDAQQAVDFSGVVFVNAPTDLFEGTIADDSVACVNFTGANLSLSDDLDNAETTGFDFSDLTDWSGAVLAGAQLRFQDFSTTNSGDPFEDFFQQLGHAVASRNDLCSDEDDDIDPVDSSPDLRGTIFSCGDLSGQDLSGTDLRGAEFVRTTIGGTGFDLSDAELEGVDFSNVIFSADSLVTIFQDIATVKQDDGDEDTVDPPVTDDDGVKYPNLRDVRLIHANLVSGAGAFDLHHVDLSGATLDGADFTGANLTDAILDNLTSLCGAYATSGSDPQSCPRDDEPELTCLTLGTASVTGASFRNVDFSELFDNQVAGVDPKEFFQRVPGGNLTGTNFSGADLAGMNLNGIDFTDALSIGLSRPCDGGNGCASFEGAKFGSSDPKKPASLSSYDFQESSIAGASFTNVSLSFADLSDVGELCTSPGVGCLSITGANSNLQNANLRDLDLRDVDFGSGADKVINFRDALFNRAILSGLDLSAEALSDRRDFSGADFSAADLSGTILYRAILVGISSGCQKIDGDDVCTIFDNAQMCGVDARGARFEGSFAGVDASSADCGEPANFRGATFVEISLDTASFENANLEDVTFENSVDFCSASGDCVDLSGASLVGATLSNIDFDAVPDTFFELVADRDLGQVDFSQSDLSDKLLEDMDLSFADLSQTDLRGASLRNSVFLNTEFALGAISDGTHCELASGGSRVDLRGADLSGADLGRAKNFQRGCIRVDGTTTYSADTRFPPGFDLLAELSLVSPGSGLPVELPIPEPNRGLLQIAALAVLAWLVHRRRYTAAL